MSDPPQPPPEGTLQAGPDRITPRPGSNAQNPSSRPATSKSGKSGAKEGETSMGEEKGSRISLSSRPASSSARSATGKDEGLSRPTSRNKVSEDPLPTVDADDSASAPEAGPSDSDSEKGLADSTDTKLDLEPWASQKTNHWPDSGKHILAQFDDESVVVYQAFCPEIAKYAVENQTFGGSSYSFNRMSWIKTNFLWMMYRAGWASKKNQERILAVKITRTGFDEILSKAYTAGKQKEMNVETKNIEVRLQWDPDHCPMGSSQKRRAIQLGLKKEILRRYATDFILDIEDITGFVHTQHKHLTTGSMIQLLTPKERVYTVSDKDVAERIGVDNLDSVVEGSST